MAADGTGIPAPHQPPIPQALDVEIVPAWRPTPLVAAIEGVHADAAALWDSLRG